MADDSLVKLFGFELRRSKETEKKEKENVSIVPKNDEDGAGYVTATAGHYGQYVDINGDQAKDNHQLILKYRGIAMHPEVDAGVEDIVNESIVAGGTDEDITLNLDEVEADDRIKNVIQEEFKNVLALLNFGEDGHDMFRRWYVDGRLYHHLVVNEKNPKGGIQEVRYIDACKIRKVKEVKTKRHPETGAKIIDTVDEYFIYQEKPGSQAQAVKITEDSISYVTSGLLDETRKKVVSHLHKAIKPVNQLRMMEDSLVIYRLARAPERRIFYIDVGNLPKGKAEEYMQNIMSKYRNKLVYDASTGNIKDDRKHMSMLEDFWLPRREGGRGTEISTLPGGDNLGQIDDIVYFQKRVYRALNVPLNRLEQEAQFSLGRSTEISRDEIKFQKFINRLRKKFSYLFLNILKKQLLLKNVITEDDWNQWKYYMVVDYAQDNHFTELKDTEIMRERLQSMDMIQQYVGEFYSKAWVMKHVLHLDEEEIKQMKDEIQAELKSGEVAADDDHINPNQDETDSDEE
jgi:hypothetical protein